MENTGFRPITDWHIDTNSPREKSIVFPGQRAVPPELYDFADRFAALVNETHRHGMNSFMVDIDDKRFRMQHMRDYKYAARLVRNDIPSFEDLRIRQPYQDLLMNEDLRRTGGLVVICGLPGAGKTTTAAATVRERLINHGGFCLTVEDPPEYRLDGRHGEHGYCEQLDASQIGYSNVIVTTLRCFPSHGQSILMFGEIRDSASAAELLRIALDGHIVITTMHASDITSAIQRLLALASKDGEQEARSLLAGSLRLVIHQRMSNGVLQMTALQTNDMVSSTIQNGNINSLKDEVARTQSRINGQR